MALVLLAIVLALAFANGANDNFKGVATVFGSGIASRKKALAWATITTFAGCLTAAWIATALAARFSGKGILPPSFLNGEVALALSGSAALVVLTATAIGMPISTTHALLGALLGVSVALQGWALPWPALVLFFVLPLATSPLVSAALAWLAVRCVRSDPACVCIEPAVATFPASPSGPAVVTVDTEAACDARGAKKLLSGRRFETSLHLLSAGAVSFARGLNDVPKIAGILLLAPAIAGQGLLLAGLGLAMALGGLIGSGRVARTMSCEITPMSDRQGLLANLVTSSLVIGASAAGLPVSTTHVSCGALGGLGVASGKLARKRFLQIVIAWGVTLPAAALASWGALRLTV